MKMVVNTPLSTLKQKQLERKQFKERLFSFGFMLLMLTGIAILGFEFTSNKIENASWIKIVAGCAVFCFSIYGIKIVLKIK